MCSLFSITVLLQSLPDINGETYVCGEKYFQHTHTHVHVYPRVTSKLLDIMLTPCMFSHTILVARPSSPNEVINQRPGPLWSWLTAPITTFSTCFLVHFLSIYCSMQILATITKFVAAEDCLASKLYAFLVPRLETARKYVGHFNT